MCAVALQQVINDVKSLHGKGLNGYNIFRALMKGGQDLFDYAICVSQFGTGLEMDFFAENNPGYEFKVCICLTRTASRDQRQIEG